MIERQPIYSIEELMELLQAEAGKVAMTDGEEFDLHATVGSNIDDAYEGGRSDGGILQARRILECLERGIAEQTAELMGDDNGDGEPPPAA